MLPRTTQNKSTDSYRMASIVMIVVVVMACVLVVNVGYFLYGMVQNMGIEGAYLAPAEEELSSSKPMALYGEWEVFDSIIPPGYEGRGELVQLPLRDIYTDYDNASYRLTLKLDEPNICLYFDYETTNTSIYLDGRLINNKAASDLKYNTIISKNQMHVWLDPSRETHELLITSTDNKLNIPMYKHVPLLGRVSTVGEHIVWVWGRDFLMLGMVLISVMNGLFFMIIRPEHKLITSQTIFDSFLGMRVIWATPVSYMLLHTLAGLSMGYSISVRLQLSALLITCFAANSLMGTICEKQKPERKLRYFDVIFWLMACAALFAPTSTLDKLRYVFVAAYIPNYVLIIMCLACSYRQNKGGYYVLRIVKTVFIFTVLFLDVLDITSLMPTYDGYTLYYATLSVLHLVIKLVDHNASYAYNEQLTHDLEYLVDERTHQLTVANEKLKKLSYRDPLTGAYNRLQFERVTEQLQEDYARAPYPFTMAILDIDFFKQVNDRYGHDIGDEILIGFVKVVKESMGEDMQLFRIGGEEFVVIHKYCGIEESHACMEAMRQKIMAHTFINGINVTASIGLAQYSGELNIKDLFRLVDKCLYRAKHGGRNRIVVADSDAEKALLSS